LRRLPSIPAALNQLFPTPWLRRAAKDSGALKRQRKVEVVLHFWCLMLVPQAAASLAAFQRRFRIAGGAKVARSAFLRRFSSGLVGFLGVCLDRAIETTVKPLATPAPFRSFADVWAQGSSLVSLSDALAAIFPGPRNKTTPAAVKINAVASVLTGSLKRLDIAEGKLAECRRRQLDGRVSVPRGRVLPAGAAPPRAAGRAGDGSRRDALRRHSYRVPQSAQSVPYVQSEVYDPGPPSSQYPS
jgi:hypothetical protein